MLGVDRLRQRGRQRDQDQCASFHALHPRFVAPTDVNPDFSQPLIAIPTLFLGGVLTSLNPCIYPMIPITAAIVVGQERCALKGAMRRARWRPLLLRLPEVLGLEVLYSVVGVIAGMTGTLFGAVSTNPWLYFAMADLLVLSALMMFEVVPVPVPTSWVE